MGAAESTAIPPPPLPQPPPPDPDDETWRQFFENYPQLSLSSLPFPPPGPHLHALATALRAATFRLRAHIAALQSHSPLPFTDAQILGALRFARSVFSSLRAHHVRHDILAEALGGVDGADELLPQDRIDIGMSVMWQVVTSGLDCVAYGVGGIAAMELVLLAIAPDEDREGALWKVASRYAHAQKLVMTLLDTASEVNVQLAELLGEEPRNETRKVGQTGVGTSITTMGMNWHGGLEVLGALAVRWRDGRLVDFPGADAEPYAHFSLEPSSPSRKERETKEIKLAQRGLELLCTLCAREDSVFRKVLVGLEDGLYSFSKMYEMLGKWLGHIAGALIGYYLMTGNRRFRTFALARTDPDVLLLPLLAALRKRCVLGGIAADAYLLVSMLVVLTADKGFCGAIDMIAVSGEMAGWVEERGRLGGDRLSLSGAVILICARGVQQSLVLRRRRPECFVAEGCVAVMANVARDVTNLHPLAAERLLSLVEFLARRRTKAILVMRHVGRMPAAPPRIGESPRKSVAEEASAKVGQYEMSAEFAEKIGEVLGVTLEVIVSILRSRSVVSVNRHLVYSLLHREAVLEMQGIREASIKCEALRHILKRVVEFFAARIEEHGENKRGNDGISVERVFDIIDGDARMLSPEVFEGVPEARFKYEEVEGVGFVEQYAWVIAMRGMQVEEEGQKIHAVFQGEKERK